MQVLVTGATGYIGSNLVRRLIKDGFAVNILVRTSSDFFYLKDAGDYNVFYYHGCLDSAESAFKDNKINCVLHLAAWSNLVHKENDIDNIIDSNIRFGTHLLQLSVKYGCKSFINTSSFSEFNEQGHYKPQSLYSASKKAFKDVIEYYCYQGSLSAISLILSDVYGTGDRRSKIFNLLKDTCVNNKKLNTTKAEQYLRPVFIDDVVDAFVQSYKILQSENIKNEHNEFFVAGEKISLKDIIHKYITMFNYDIKNINFGALDYHEKQIMNPYVGKILQNWQPKTSIEEGLKILIDE